MSKLQKKVRTESEAEVKWVRFLIIPLVAGIRVLVFFLVALSAVYLTLSHFAVERAKNYLVG